jgi:hypothetical protein
MDSQDDVVGYRCYNIEAIATMIYMYFLNRLDRLFYIGWIDNCTPHGGMGTCGTPHTESERISTYGTKRIEKLLKK